MKKIKNLTKRIFSAKRVGTLAMLLFCGVAATYAQNAAGDYTAGTNALTTVTEEIAKYVPYVVKLCYAIAGVVAVVGAISVYIAMNNEEQDVKKKIMMVVGACIFLVAAAQALPLFFGITRHYQRLLGGLLRYIYRRRQGNVLLRVCLLAFVVAEYVFYLLE